MTNLPQNTSLLDLVSQAGGFQWPIFAVLIAGLLVLCARLVRLMSDYLAGRRLRKLPLKTLSQADLAAALSHCTDSLYARLLTGMLEIAQVRPGDAAALGQETLAVAGAARAAYRRTERVVAFLSSSAGGLGLLGTLVGIYVLFSAGTRDAETVFAGIAIAVVFHAVRHCSNHRA